MIQIWRTWEDDPVKIRALLTRPPVEAAKEGRGARAKTVEVFGEDLAPAEAVAKILSEVESTGKAAVIHYTKAFDGVELSASELIVSEEELRQAESMVDKATYQSMVAKSGSPLSIESSFPIAGLKQERMALILACASCL